MFLAFLPLALAQETLPLGPQPSPTPNEYNLPYPGILPDHPLYLIKQLRDQILLNLIASPVKKTEFHILLADKYLAMSTLLLDKNKPDLAVETVKKSGEQLKLAKEKIMTVPVETNDAVANTKHRLEASMEEQIEVLTGQITRVEGVHQEALTIYLQNMNQMLTEYKNQK